MEELKMGMETEMGMALMVTVMALMGILMGLVMDLQETVVETEEEVNENATTIFRIFKPKNSKKRIHTQKPKPGI